MLGNRVIIGGLLLLINGELLLISGHLLLESATMCCLIGDLPGVGRVVLVLGRCALVGGGVVAGLAV